MSRALNSLGPPLSLSVPVVGMVPAGGWGWAEGRRVCGYPRACLPATRHGTKFTLRPQSE